MRLVNLMAADEVVSVFHCTLGILIVLAFLSSVAVAAETKPIAYEQYLRESAVSREVIERLLHGPSWAQFDPELGYILGNYLPAVGLDGSATISTSQTNGARTSFVYANRKCRINTYGNSFTQCHQISDAETWQEYLAGHLGEPIRNFGMAVTAFIRRIAGCSARRRPITLRLRYVGLGAAAGTTSRGSTGPKFRDAVVSVGWKSAPGSR